MARKTKGTTTALTTTQRSEFERIAGLAVNAVTSEHTQRAYRSALYEYKGRGALPFLLWYAQTGQTELNKATVNNYVQYLREQGTPPSSINNRLVAVRKFVIEAADNGLIAENTAAAIKRVKGDTQRGVRLGNWLTLEEAQRLLNAPDVETAKGLRDRAVLAVMLGCGLRREECVSLTVEHIQQRFGRWVIVDIVGKRQKARSVPMPSWTKTAVDAWTARAHITGGALFLTVNKGGHVGKSAMSAQAIYNLVSEYSAAIGMGENVKVKGQRRTVTATVKPHDLRRTFAHLAHEGTPKRPGAPIEQIQLSLGHDSVATTERYLGVKQDMKNAPADSIDLSLER